MKGFTLIELLTITFMIAILLSVSLPRFSSELIWHTQAYSEARNIAANILYTRSLAINTSSNHKIEFIPSQGPFTDFRIWREDEGAWTMIEENALSGGMVISGDSEFVFQPLGNPISGGQLSVVKESKTFLVVVDPVIGKVEVRSP
jgi:Tfp pilus assembly protein FimT